jgi:ribosomal protein S18 acetylase RimI-like enzyme
MADIVRAATDDWARLREIRLRALEDSPSAFASRLDRERDQPESFWYEWLEGEGTFLAIEGDAAVGLVSVFLMDEEPGTAHLVSMWVEPEHRRRGLGRRLIEAVLGWARERQAERIRLWVTETNEDARRLYRSTGFVETGDRQPLPSDLTLQELAMEQSLEP